MAVFTDRLPQTKTGGRTMEVEKIDRINALAHKAKSVGLTEEEKKERELLRKEYIASVRMNLRAQLDNVDVQQEDGTIIDSPAIAMKKRVGYVSKDRDVESLCLNASIEDNISIAGMSEFAINNFLILKNREKKYVNHQIEELSIKCAGRDQSVSQLSGGNKQKVVFGKWIGCGSEILILDCPTRGVDIGVKQAMYQLMVRLKNEGKSILMISEELPELIGMSDRILIMKNGEVSAEFERSETLSDAQIIEYMI